MRRASIYNFQLCWAVQSVVAVARYSHNDEIEGQMSRFGLEAGLRPDNAWFLLILMLSFPYSFIGSVISDGSPTHRNCGLAAAIDSFLLACLLFVIGSLWVSRSRRPPTENGCFQLHAPAIEKVLLEYKTLTATRYTYNEITKMTKKIKYKLGQGGYGTVFQGWLSNGTPVAVKQMEKSYNDGEEFWNEFATIGMIHHVNVVRLLGFCIEGSRRALVYEFKANGSLEKITNSIIAGRCMFRPKRLYDIGLGIAKGIEYLHQGCHLRIIHFDIKPHNILLGQDFIPKISDFGLARSYCKGQSIVTITEGKGTISYIAPELFYGNSKHVSHKSDVYSFGMLLIAVLGMKEKASPLMVILVKHIFFSGFMTHF
ncbi:rust resistance kinase Lr10-like [Nymphaea colorata]|nr:rust resistance kinase Lr10-like [Nymphaea colorata]